MILMDLGINKKQMGLILGSLLDEPNVLCPHEFYNSNARRDTLMLKDNVIDSFIGTKLYDTRKNA